MGARTIARSGPSWPCDNHRVFHTDLNLLARVAIGCAVAYAFGFERQLRGSPAGDRTFTLIGGAATAVTAVAGLQSPQAVAGILTGLGFIGAGLVFTSGNKVRGLTSAATVFAVAAIGIVIGYDHVYLGLFLAALLMFVLEIEHIPFVRFLDARTYADRFANDAEPTIPEGGPHAAGPHPAGPHPSGPSPDPTEGATP
jgi:putative Mg2+ transporter-C (MgtC) family protein